MKYYISILISVLLIMFSGCSIKQEEEQNQVENIEKTENNNELKLEFTIEAKIFEEGI